MRITEQRNEASGEKVFLFGQVIQNYFNLKEVKFEVSRRDDYEFLYAEVLNNEKYQILARSYDLTVDFDTFPKVVIQHILCKNNTRLEEEGKRGLSFSKTLIENL